MRSSTRCDAEAGARLIDTLIVINGEPVPTADALGWAALLGGPDLRDFALRQVAVAQAARARGFEAAPEEIRELFVEMRYMMRLESGEALKAWMADNAVTPEVLSEACAQLVLRRKLRETITPDLIERNYVENRPSYDRVTLYRIRVGDADVAQELRALVLNEDESFCLLAMEHSTDAETAHMGGYLGEVARGELAGDIEAMVFGAEAGDVVGPVKVEGVWEVFLVHAVRTQPLEEVAEDIREAMFQDMIEGAAGRARVEPG